MQSETRGPVAVRDRALSAVGYVGIIPAIVFLVIPALRGNSFIRFHSWQSVMFSVASVILALALRLFFVIFSLLPIVGFLLAWLLLGIGGLGVFMLWIVLVVKAAQGHKFDLPIIGPLAERLATGTQFSSVDSH